MNRCKMILTPDQLNQLHEWQRQTLDEAPSVSARLASLDAAAAEDSFRGQLRRAIRDSRLHPVRLADRVGLDPLEMDRFLTGESALASDVVDRLVSALGLKLTSAQAGRT